MVGATLAVPFGLALTVRPAIARAWVDPAPLRVRPRRQFWLELILMLAASLAAGIYNRAVHGFPLASSLSLLVGTTVLAVFAGLDAALARERRSIREAGATATRDDPPRHRSSLTRRFALTACVITVLVTLTIALVVSRDFAWLVEIDRSPGDTAAAWRAVVIEVLFIMAVLLALVSNLIVGYARTLKLLFDNETAVLERIGRGDLSRLVPVLTDDEFGMIAAHTNAMIKGLRHRLRLIGALKLAEEVQRSFLPIDPPQTATVDLAGVSVYCEETGGDYWDVARLPDDRLAVLVADAADHGIGAALHMAAARAFLLAELRTYTGPADLVRRVNRHLVRDGRDTGRFVTLFFLEIDTRAQRLRWVRAGHEPALLYDPAGDRFTTLGGHGMALGVAETPLLEESAPIPWPPGSVVLVGTDGLRELRNPSGEMVPQQLLRDLLRRHASQPAAVIRDRILTALRAHRATMPQEDDLTLAVVKRNDEG